MAVDVKHPVFGFCQRFSNVNSGIVELAQLAVFGMNKSESNFIKDCYSVLYTTYFPIARNCFNNRFERTSDL